MRTYLTLENAWMGLPRTRFLRSPRAEKSYGIAGALTSAGGCA